MLLGHIGDLAVNRLRPLSGEKILNECVFLVEVVWV